MRIGNTRPHPTANTEPLAGPRGCDWTPLYIGLALACAALLALGSTGCDGGNFDASGPGQPDASVPGPGCQSDDACGGGVCLAGHCCESASRVCGDKCCGASEVCFANACVSPGKTCFSQADCGADQYCEIALGEGGSEPRPGTEGGRQCLNPLPNAGRCLDLPPRCKAGQSPEADGCLPECTVHPEGKVLQAVAEWRWSGDTVREHPDHLDVWSTPVVGRVTDSNCDGKVNELDPPNVIFVAGDAKTSCCSCADPQSCRTGVLRVLDGASGKEVWSLRTSGDGSVGFAGLSTALADVDLDGRLDIVAMTGEGRVTVIDHSGKVMGTSKELVRGSDAKAFGWGGGLAVADMDGDGKVEIAYAGTVFTYDEGTVKLRFDQAGTYLSTFVDLDGAPDGNLELLTGNRAYRADGTQLWVNSEVSGHPGIGDFNQDAKPEVVLVGKGTVRVLDGATGKTVLGPLTLPGTGTGGPPTVADFDGDGKPEIGVAMATFYSVVETDYDKKQLTLRWKAPNHDLSSSVTGSTVFDFEGDGSAEVIYNDECFLWVYDGKTGKVRFATPTTSFTATEASLVADVDGDGRAEMVMISNGANPGSKGWKCDVAPWNAPDAKLGRPAWKPPANAPAYRGITLWGDRFNAWVGTRTLWNQHTYHVSNICDSRDGACEDGANRYGAVPARETPNWALPWLNNFRQNVQDKGIFDAPDATVTLRIPCASPMSLQATVRNLGLTPLPKGVEVSFYVVRPDGTEAWLSRATTATSLFPGQAVELAFAPPDDGTVSRDDTFIARITADATKQTFNECRDDNNASDPVTAPCKLK